MNRIPEDDEWNILSEVASNKYPTPDRPLPMQLYDVQVRGMENKPLGNIEDNPLSVIEGQQNSYECRIKSFDSRNSNAVKP